MLDLVPETEAMKETAARVHRRRGQAEGYRRFMQMSEQLHGVSDRFFFWRASVAWPTRWMSAAAFSAAVLKDVLSLRMGRSVASVVRSHVPDHRVAQMMDHFTQYVGSSPYASPAVLCGIAHMQTDEGIWYPIGGTRAVPEALARVGDGTGGRHSDSGTDVHANPRPAATR